MRIAFFVLVLSLMIGLPVNADRHSSVADEVIALAKAQWAANMANAKVQVYGDVAILSYNYLGSTLNADGEVKPNLAKSTRVYAKIDGAWKLVHANFAPIN